MNRSRNITSRPRRASAFTLVELLVTMVIMSILAGLSLSGLAASRQRAKIDKTKSTIRKLHEIVLPQYESYLTRRVSATGAANKLAAVRLLMVQEMPDQWADVYPVASLTTLNPAPTAPTRRYAQYEAALAAASGTQWSGNSAKYEDAECLAMILTRGGISPDAIEQFRTDEMGDIDDDGAPEFWDGWGRPIRFIRWPAGFASVIQPLNASTNPDPFDPTGVSGDYGLTPLLYSTGPNAATDDPLTASNDYAAGASGLANLPLRTTRFGSPLPGTVISTTAGDNITNHDLMAK